MRATLDGEPVPYWQARRRQGRAGAEARRRQGARASAPISPCAAASTCRDYLGSRSTFTLGKFGGHAGRALKTGDVLHVGAGAAGDGTRRAYLPDCGRASPTQWDIGVLYGPHGAPDFFTPDYIETFFAADWEVHYNSNPTGIRLIGPKPGWARDDGGEAGLHPSNIHDNAYAIGTIDFTGDMPVILGPDGPSLGGFVCPATIVQAELWKMGQLRPGDKVRFIRLTPAEAAQRLAQARCRDRRARGRSFACGCRTRRSAPTIASSASATPRATDPRVVYRRAGDAYLLIEYGPIVLDFALRFRVHALMQAVDEAIDADGLTGIIDLTPGIRSLQIHYDPRILPLDDLIDALQSIEDELGDLSDMEVQLAHRASAAVVERRGRAADDRQIYARRARRRALVPVQYRVHPPHQRPRTRSTT